MKKTIFRLTVILLVFSFVSISVGNGEVMAMENGRMFEDVPEYHWAFNYINKAFDKDFFVETDGNKFEPDKSVTRAEFVQIVVVMFELPVPVDSRQVYEDVGKETAYYKAVAAAEDAGILNDIKENMRTFMPDRPITREEAASILGLITSYLGIMTTMQYVDLNGIYEDYHKANPKYSGAMQTMYKLGIMNGMTAIEFAPKGIVTRAQAATMLVKLLDVVELVIG